MNREEVRTIEAELALTALVIALIIRLLDRL
jgi:hypothetical protein